MALQQFLDKKNRPQNFLACSQSPPVDIQRLIHTKNSDFLRFFDAFVAMPQPSAAASMLWFSCRLSHFEQLLP